MKRHVHAKRGTSGMALAFVRDWQDYLICRNCGGQQPGWLLAWKAQTCDC
jgi:hypothetical protein